jgi:simple sugar transport system permease protein
MVKLLFQGDGDTGRIQGFNEISIPYLVDIPIAGKAFFQAYPTTYLAILLVIIGYFTLYKTPFGLRLRSVGEHPGAADTVGIKVNRLRYIGVMISGALAGIGGATITLTTTNMFSHNTVSGQGYIAIAAMIFGKWNPLGAFGAAVFFGFSQAIRNYVQLFAWSQSIPQEIIFMLPYLLTIIVLVAAVGRSRAPAALGQLYDPSKR